MAGKKAAEFMMINRRSGKALQATGLDNGLVVEQAEPVKSDAQLWSLVETGDTVKLFNKACGKVLDVMQAAHAAGKTIVRLHTGDPCLYGAIREQMDALDRLDIPYDDTPGVSSFCGAAAAVCGEYTLPGVSQTVIITRMAGRTPVPERENITALAAHGATMVIFLSAGMLDGLQAALLQGAYTAQTPAALVYKASWPEEKVVRCPLGQLAQAGRAHGISKTALVLVGDFLADEYQRSKLYDPTFSTEFREATV